MIKSTILQTKSVWLLPKNVYNSDKQLKIVMSQISHMIALCWLSRRCFGSPVESVTGLLKGQSMTNNFLCRILKLSNMKLWARLYSECLSPSTVWQSHRPPHTSSWTLGHNKPTVTDAAKIACKAINKRKWWKRLGDRHRWSPSRRRLWPHITCVSHTGVPHNHATSS